jgi:hypothetical protein
MSTTNSNRNKNDFLGIPFGTATSKLRKMILFDLVKKSNLDICYRCGNKIENIVDFSIEHKLPWLGIDIDLFWNLDNIAFSHLHCNSSDRKYPGRMKPLVHGTGNGYWNKGCRCDKCKKWVSDYMYRYKSALSEAES